MALRTSGALSSRPAISLFALAMSFALSWTLDGRHGRPHVATSGLIASTQGWWDDFLAE
jgi:hypothetical protein